MITRTIRETTVYAKVVAVENGEVVTKDLTPITYTGRKKTEGGLRREFASQLEDKSAQILINGEKENERYFQCSVEDFMEIAEEVSKEEVENQ